MCTYTHIAQRQPNWHVSLNQKLNSSSFPSPNWSTSLPYIIFQWMAFSSHPASFQTRNPYVGPGWLSPILLSIIKACAFYMSVEDSINSHLSNTPNPMFLLPQCTFHSLGRVIILRHKSTPTYFHLKSAINVILLSMARKHSSPFKAYCLLYPPLSFQWQFYKTVPLAVLSTCHL